jgi:hypothetical protein
MLVDGQPPLPRDNTHEDNHHMYDIGTSGEEGNGGGTLIPSPSELTGGNTLEVVWVAEDCTWSSKCKGTSIRFLTSPLLSYSHPQSPLFICISPIPLYHPQGPYQTFNDSCIQKFNDSHIQKSDDSPDVDSPNVVDFSPLPPLVP